MQDAPRYDATQPVPVTPAGWYPLNGELRYWDGVRWTEHRASVPAPPPPPPAASQVVHHYHHSAAPVLITDARVSGAALAVAWVIAVVTFGYMLPWAVAATRGKSNSGAIAVVNLLLGWSLIGWVVALVMACGSHQVAAVRHQY
jgi:cytochrome b561